MFEPVYIARRDEFTGAKLFVARASGNVYWALKTACTDFGADVSKKVREHELHW